MSRKNNIQFKGGEASFATPNRSPATAADISTNNELSLSKSITPPFDNRSPRPNQDNELNIDVAADEAEQPAQSPSPKKPRVIKLYKGSRLKGYITLTLSSAINYNAARKCMDTVGGSAVACSVSQRRYALAVASISLVLSTIVTFCHLDPSPLKVIWHKIFQPKSKVELVMILFLIAWWSIAVGIQTTIQGIAGDGSQQFTIYYSSWLCGLVSYWVMEKYLIDAGWSSFMGFISSWPYRAPVWISIALVSIFTFIWYMDLWYNHTPPPPQGTATNQTDTSQATIQDVPKGQWEWLVVVAIFTFFPAAAFVLMELFRDVTADGRSEKPSVENIAEGIVFAILCVAWVPTVIIATTPGGAASLTGNAYFFTWLLVVFLFEGLVWWIHDYRLEIHHELKKKAMEYKQRQKEVLETTMKLHQQRLAEVKAASEGADGDNESSNESEASEEIDVFEDDLDNVHDVILDH